MVVEPARVGERPHAHDGQTGPLGQHGQRRPRELLLVIGHVPIDPAPPKKAAPVRARIRGGHDDGAAGPQDAGDVAQELPGIAHVLDHLVERHVVKGVERVVGSAEQPDTGVEAETFGDPAEVLVRIHPVGLAATGRVIRERLP